MLVICEECAKKYHVDASKIKGQQARFACKACGHVIVVEKPKPVAPKPVAAVEALPKHTVPTVASALAKGRGRPFVFYLLTVATVGLLATGCSFIFLYFRYVPELIQQQMDLRSLLAASSLKEKVAQPLLRKDYLLVNQETKRVAKMPGVAYAAVMNEKGAVVAGSFNTMNSFESRFVQKVKETGFPVDVLAQNGLKAGAKEGSIRISMGGLAVHDRVLALPDIDGEIHIGLFAAEADSAVWQTLLSPLLFVPAGLALLCIFLLSVLADWLIVRPAHTLAGTANRISLGELDLAITAEGSREIRELSMALERMRHSVRIALDKLTRSH